MRTGSPGDIRPGFNLLLGSLFGSEGREGGRTVKTFHPACSWDGGHPCCPRLTSHSFLLLRYGLGRSVQPPASRGPWAGPDHSLPSLCSLKLFSTFFYVFIKCSRATTMFKVERVVLEASGSACSFKTLKQRK